MRTFAMVCCLAAGVVIGFGPWAALQTVAWAKMAVDYTRETGNIRQGLAETFDGEHPCELCRQIRAGAEKERHEQPQKPGKEDSLGKIKLAAVLPVNARAVFLPVVANAAFFSNPCQGRLLDAPPTPPPRAA